MELNLYIPIMMVIALEVTKQRITAFIHIDYTAVVNTNFREI
jgi:hypothetical protein